LDVLMPELDGYQVLEYEELSRPVDGVSRGLLFTF
jgi:hypothetical protein